MRFLLEPATEAHDAALRRLLAENEMEGEIALSFRREPSYFHATAVQGGFAQVVAARDTRSGSIVGVATRAVRPGYLNGEEVPVGYLADLRIAPECRSGMLFIRAYRHLAQLHADGRTRLYFTVVAEGNRKALRNVLRGTKGMPPYRDMGRLLSPAVNLLRRKPRIEADCEIVRGTSELLPQIVECLNRTMRRRQFAPAYTVEQFTDSAPTPNAQRPTPSLPDFHIEDFYAALRGDRVIGTLAKWDQGAFKQTVVTGYHGRMRWVRPLVNAASGLIGCARFPEPGEPLRSFYAALPTVDDDELPVFRALLRRLYNDHASSDYAYFLLGLHERDPLAAALRDYVLTPFAGRLFCVHFPDGEAVYHSLDDRVPYVELAAL